jgi:probable rRNA maturation factor
VNEVSVSFIGTEKPVWARRVSRLCGRILDLLNLDDWEVSLLICDDEKMRELNKRYRGRDSSTDVLSFGQEPDAARGNSPCFPRVTARHLAGDVVISAERLEEQARAYGVAAEREFERLMVHGILHLSGMNHDKENNAMLVLQDRILKELRSFEQAQ